MFLVNSRHSHFSAAQPRYAQSRAPLLPKLRGHFAEFLNQSSLERLGLFTPPTCVGLRYGRMHLCLEDFLGSMDSTASELTLTASRLRLTPRGFACGAPCALAPAIPTAGLPILLRPSITRCLRYGNINPLSIDYGFRPRLRTRLTPGRLPLPGKPWVYGERVSHPFYRYLCQHNHFSEVQGRLHSPFSPQRTLPYRDVSQRPPKLRRHA